MKLHFFYTAIFIVSIFLLSCITEPEGCELGFTKINGECYSDADMEVLQAFADSSGIVVNPLSLSTQKWNENGQLTMLWLYDDTLSCGIPENIGNLVYLDTLNLALNQMSGEIPKGIGELENLNYLYLYSNKLSGTIPGSICNIYPNLSNFWIQYNSLCPPYPECIPEDEIHPQDTSQCP